MSVSENSNKLFIHLGPQKTGSTSMQRFILKNQSKLDHRFRFYTHRNSEISRILSKMITRYSINPNDENEGGVRLAVDRLADAVRSQEGACLISNERYLGAMMGSHDEMRFLPNADKIISLFNDGFAELKPTYILYTRQKDTWLRSAHGQAIRSDRFTKTFKDYEAECETDFTWSSLVETIESVVGSENLYCFPLEKEDDVAYPGKQLLSAMGLSDQDIHSLDPMPKKLNSSLKPSALELVRRINTLDLNGKDAKAVRKMVAQSQELFDGKLNKLVELPTMGIKQSEIKALAPKEILMRVAKGKPIGGTAHNALRNPDIREFVLQKAIDRLAVLKGVKKQRFLEFVRVHLDKENRIQKALFKAALGKKPEARGMLHAVIEDSSLPAEQCKRARKWLRFLDNEAELDLNISPGVMPRVFQFWDENLPSDVKKATDAWRNAVGSQNYFLYNDEMMRELVYDSLGGDFGVLYDGIYTASIKADIFRMLAIYNHGGVYIDADFHPQPTSAMILPQLNHKNVIWGRTDGKNVKYTSWFMSGKAGWSSLKTMLVRAFQNLENSPNMSPLSLAGPFLVAEVLYEQDPQAQDYTILSNGFGRKHLVKAYQPEYQKSDLHWKNAFKKRKAANKKSQT